MGKVLIVGCGGVASVAVHKCCQNSKVFDAICIASRTVSKCEALKEKLQDSYNGTITTAQVDADNTEELIALIEKEKPDSILPTLGGQAGLNLAMEIAETGFLEENNCRLIGTTSETKEGRRPFGI
jgi:saccharopine dehydrogenase-like NADP-dependent oxidoreductase